jgi:hypothetical protein
MVYVISMTSKTKEIRRRKLIQWNFQASLLCAYPLLLKKKKEEKIYENKNSENENK